MSTSERYALPAVVLHWAIAVGVVCLIVVGTVMTRLPPRQLSLKFDLYQLHKSVGITVLLLTVLRTAWRLARGAPPLLPALAEWERRLAQITHTLFYVLLIVVPLVGWAVVSVSPLGLPTVLYGLVPWPHIPVLSALPHKEALEGTLTSTHHLLAYTLLALVALHIAGVLKHHFLDRTQPLARMSPVFKRSLPVLLFALVGLVAAPAWAAKWVVDPAKSRLGFSVLDVGAAQDAKGSFGKWTAVIDFDPANLDQSSVDVTVDLGSADAQDRQRNAVLPTADWFNVAAFPKGQFVAKRFNKLADGSYEALGTLSMRGTTKDVKLAFTLEIADGIAHAKGTTTVMRPDFKLGMSRNEEWVGYPVKVTFDLTATSAK